MRFSLGSRLYINVGLVGVKVCICNPFFSGVHLENGNSISSALVHQNGDSLDTTTSEESNQGIANGKTTTTLLDEDTNTSFADNSSPASIEAEETNDSVVSDSTNDSMAPEYKRTLDEDDSNSLETPTKKLRQDVGDK